MNPDESNFVGRSATGEGLAALFLKRLIVSVLSAANCGSIAEIIAWRTEPSSCDALISICIGNCDPSLSLPIRLPIEGMSPFAKTCPNVTGVFLCVVDKFCTFTVVINPIVITGGGVVGGVVGGVTGGIVGGATGGTVTIGGVVVPGATFVSEPLPPHAIIMLLNKTINAIFDTLPCFFGVFKITFFIVCLNKKKRRKIL